MHVALDIDETITAAPIFFAFLARALRRERHRVTVVTIRRCRGGAEETLRKLGIEHDGLVTLPPDYEGCVITWKVEQLHALAVDVVVDDLPAVANRVRDGVLVLVPRDPEMGFLAHVGEDLA
jgi:hypothetical protein